MMGHFELAAMIGPVLMILHRLGLIPKLEYTGILVALLFAILSFSVGTFGLFAKTFGICILSYFVSIFLQSLFPRKAAPMELFSYSLLFSFQAALFCALLGGLTFFISSVGQ